MPPISLTHTSWLKMPAEEPVSNCPSSNAPTANQSSAPVMVSSRGDWGLVMSTKKVSKKSKVSAVPIR